VIKRTGSAPGHLLGLCQHAPVAISPYVRDLRDLVGDRLLLLPSVAVFVRDDAGRVLLVRHSDTGQWGAVGGGIDPGESPAEAARREAWE
jgi:8-oxo-dGTP pyrophosphatase MutT (NUDIX family)